MAEEPATKDASLHHQSDSLQAVHETSYTTEDEAIPNILEKYDTTPCRSGSKLASADDDSSAAPLLDGSANQVATEGVPTTKVASVDDDSKGALLLDSSANQVATEVVPSTQGDEKVVPSNDAIKSSPSGERSCNADGSLEPASSDCDLSGGQVRRQVGSRAHLYSGKSIHSLTTEEFRLLSFVFDSPPSDEESLGPPRGSDPIEETTEPDHPTEETVEDEDSLSPAPCDQHKELTEPDSPIDCEKAPEPPLDRVDGPEEELEASSS